MTWVSHIPSENLHSIQNQSAIGKTHNLQIKSLLDEQKSSLLTNTDHKHKGENEIVLSSNHVSSVEADHLESVSHSSWDQCKKYQENYQTIEIGKEKKYPKLQISSENDLKDTHKQQYENI